MKDRSVRKEYYKKTRKAYIQTETDKLSLVVSRRKMFMIIQGDLFFNTQNHFRQSQLASIGEGLQSNKRMVTIYEKAKQKSKLE